MKEIEFLMLTNQSLILNGLATLVRSPLGEALMEQANNTIKYLEENLTNIEEKEQ
jgi:hypothetical protein